MSTTGGNGQKFIGASKAEAESILKDALSNGKIVSISDNGGVLANSSNKKTRSYGNLLFGCELHNNTNVLYIKETTIDTKA